METQHAATPAGRPRARSLGIPFGGTPGRWNAITDVPGLEAGFCSQNGYGEMTGVSWIGESGTFSGPIAITNTHAVGIAHAGIVAWTVKHHPRLADAWLLPVAAETWDGYLNDINGHHVTEQTAIDALEAAASGPLEEGSVGGGTGMHCYQFKGGSGTASRLIGYGGTDFTVGVFVQANFGSREELVLAGEPLGALLTDDNPLAEHFAMPAGAGSVVAIVATDAPLLPHQCQAMARRVTLGLARTGAPGSHFSGDLFLAFSTANPGGITPGVSTFRPGAEGRYDQLSFVPWGFLDPFSTGVVQATEEAVANALTANEDMTGRDGHRTPALPRDRVAEVFRGRRQRG